MTLGSGPRPSPTAVVIEDVTTKGVDGPIPPGAVDTGDADAAATAIIVADVVADGVTHVRTTQPKAARRAATVIEAILAARPSSAAAPKGR